jgi:hypothetical protein
MIMTRFHYGSLMLALDDDKIVVFFPQEFLEVNAYYRWEKEGRPEGKQLDHYSEAERTYQECFKNWYNSMYGKEIVGIISLPTAVYAALDKAKSEGLRVNIR